MGRFGFSVWGSYGADAPSRLRLLPVYARTLPSLRAGGANPPQWVGYWSCGQGVRISSAVSGHAGPFLEANAVVSHALRHVTRRPGLGGPFLRAALIPVKPVQRAGRLRRRSCVLAPGPVGRVAWHRRVVVLHTFALTVLVRLEPLGADARYPPKRARFIEGRFRHPKMPDGPIQPCRSMADATVSLRVDWPAPLYALVRETRSGATRIGFRRLLLAKATRWLHDDRCRRLRGYLSRRPHMITLLPQT